MQISIRLQQCGQEFDRVYSGALQVEGSVMSLGASASEVSGGVPVARYMLTATLAMER
jgi:hypothetical protein